MDYIKQPKLIPVIDNSIDTTDNYSIATIKRKSDNKKFECWFRNGNVKIFKEGEIPGYRHYFIETAPHSGNEELCLYSIDLKLYDILEIVID